jgi:eukaryotic-like serine/threonine-protein kinase
MSDPKRCESCGGALPETGVLRGRCPRCMVELGLESESDFRGSEILRKALADEGSMVGRQLGHYQVLALVGVGGMGAVWKGKDTSLDREVAIKTLPEEEFALQRERLARFEREAKLLASLNHPNIAAVHEFDEDTGVRFLVLEFIEGDTLEDRLRHGAIPLEESLRLARQISEALEAAHEKGIIHRDLKPANIKVTDDGTVKVLDFGLAKAFAGDGLQANTVDSPSLSIEGNERGMILGTAAYMAPEQAAGKRVDRRADIWAFGVVMYEMITGTRPFVGADVTETIASVMTKEPDFDQVPTKVRRLLRKCLEKDPKRRLRDIGDAWELLDDQSVAADEAHSWSIRRNTTLLWILASVPAIAALVFFFLWLKPRPLPEVVRFQIQAPPGARLHLGPPAISNDGRTLAYTVVDLDGVTRIHVRAIDGVESRALPGTEGAFHMFWTPRGDSLAFVAGLRLKGIDMTGGSVSDLIGVNNNLRQGAWNQNDDILVRVGRELVRFSARGGVPTPIPNSSDATNPAFLSDGQRFLVRVNSDNRSSIQLCALGSSERRLVVDNVSSAPVLAPTPRGKTYLLFLREADLMAQEFDEAPGKVLGNPMLLVPRIGRVSHPPVIPTVGVSPSGTLAYQNADQVENRRLQWVDRSGVAMRTLSPDVLVAAPRLSPDQKSVAGTRQLGGRKNIWVTDLVRESSESKTFDGHLRDLAAWSRDGSRLAVSRQSGGIYTIDVNGGGKPKLLIEAQGWPTSWAGQYLLYNSQQKIYLLDVASDKGPIQVGSPNGDSYWGEFSPDGNYIAFSSDRSGRSEVYVQPIPPGSGETRVSINGGTLPRWRGDGKEIFFVSPDGDLMAMDIKLGDAVSAGTPHKLFRFDSRDGSEVALNGYDVARDGKRFLIVSESEEVNVPITVVLNWWVELEKRLGGSP